MRSKRIKKIISLEKKINDIYFESILEKIRKKKLEGLKPVGVHVRDGEYTGYSQTVRDSDINNYSRTLNKLTEEGYLIIRLGSSGRELVRKPRFNFIDLTYSKISVTEQMLIIR